MKNEKPYTYTKAYSNTRSYNHSYTYTNGSRAHCCHGCYDFCGDVRAVSYEESEKIEKYGFLRLAPH